MHPFKTLLVALLLGGSAAALAADTSRSSSTAATFEPTPRYAQGWPALRKIEHVWPQWMRNLQGAVLALDAGANKRWNTMPCAEQRCTEASAQTVPALRNADTDQHQLDDLPQVHPATLLWHSEQPLQAPQRLSF
ncbi:hypothetical protein [uncultured Pseudomonas sp.]|uniref:hypothetical protein n=1 Tax=uncultured Pseudomonas sp. TaxID=114707 RepID=UPI00262C5908|nr:hypothetical protein [uncultured Pseudomonas sp.]